MKMKWREYKTKGWCLGQYQSWKTVKIRSLHLLQCLYPNHCLCTLKHVHITNNYLDWQKSHFRREYACIYFLEHMKVSIFYICSMMKSEFIFIIDATSLETFQPNQTQMITWQVFSLFIIIFGTNIIYVS